MKNSKIKDMVIISMCVAIISVCAWISIPFVVSFSLQTFAIFVICAVFGFKICFPSVAIYIILGALGVPVFSAFGAGIGTLLGPTGGYIFGFLFIPPIMRLILRNNTDGVFLQCVAMLLSLCACYAFGTIWYYLAFAAHSDITIWTTLCVCVFPFIIPDLIKIFLAAVISRRLNKNILGGI